MMRFLLVTVYITRTRVEMHRNSFHDFGVFGVLLFADQWNDVGFFIDIGFCVLFCFVFEV